MPAQPPVVTRFAPSPTGHLHIGGARTALFCWAFARRMGGVFLLRIEDTDQARSSEASARGILEDLVWLGIGWDEGPQYETQASGIGPRASGNSRSRFGGDPRHVGPFYQSQRIEIYNEWIGRLIDQGKAYADFSTAAELEKMRQAATAAKETFKYRPPDSAILPLAEQRARMKDGVPHVVRLRTPPDAVTVKDEVLGDVAFGSGEIDDFVLRKQDGFPTYHFGVVVDDELMGVTHVLRGQEHLMNTPRHVALQRALGFRTPVYAHMPLIFNEAGAKMSKRERDKTAREAVKKAGLKASPIPGAVPEAEFGAWLADSKRQLETMQLEALAQHMGLRLPEVSVDDFRRAGYLPEVVCNYIALLGWNPGLKNPDGTDFEKFDMGFMAEHFDLSRIGKTNSRFDRTKLGAFNKDAIGAMAPGEFAARWGAWLEAYGSETGRALLALDERRFALCAEMARPRCRTLGDAHEAVLFVITPDDAVVYDEKAVEKTLLKGEPRGLDVLKDVRGVIESVEPFEPEAIEGAIKAFAESRGLGMGKVAQPLRVAVTGTGVSPALGETLAAIGREVLLPRDDRCLGYIAPAGFDDGQATLNLG